MIWIGPSTLWPLLAIKVGLWLAATHLACLLLVDLHYYMMTELNNVCNALVRGLICTHWGTIFLHIDIWHNNTGTTYTIKMGQRILVAKLTRREVDFTFKSECQPDSTRGPVRPSVCPFQLAYRLNCKANNCLIHFYKRGCYNNSNSTTMKMTSKNEDGLKNEDNIKDEDDLTNEDNSKNGDSSSWLLLHNWPQTGKSSTCLNQK